MLIHINKLSDIMIWEIITEHVQPQWWIRLHQELTQYLQYNSGKSTLQMENQQIKNNPKLI